MSEIIKLRDYQATAFERLAKLLTFECPVRAYCTVLPTGAGKSVIIGALVSWYVQMFGGSVLVCSWSAKIVEQDRDKIEAFGCDMCNVVCTTVQKMFHMEAQSFDLIVVDECHKMYIGTAGYNEIVKRMHNSNGELRNAQSDTVVIGLTATPYRNPHQSALDDGMFVGVDDCVTYKSLIGQGYLVPPEYIKCALFTMNRAKLAVTNGDFSADSMETQCKRAKKAIADAIIQTANTCKQKVPNACTLVFLPSKRICEEIEGILAKQGIKADVVLGETPEDDRDEIYTKSNIILNCGVMTTGIDIPRVTAIVMCRATKSVTLWKQIIGRGLRLHNGKSKCFVIDCGGNVETFGDDLDYFPSTIKEKRVGMPVLSECPQCHRYISPLSKQCKFCHTTLRTDEEIHNRKLLNVYYEGGMVPVKEYKIERKFIPTIQDHRKVITIKPYVGKQFVFTFSSHPYSQEKFEEYKKLLKYSDDVNQLLFIRVDKVKGFLSIVDAKVLKLNRAILSE